MDGWARRQRQENVLSTVSTVVLRNPTVTRGKSLGRFRTVQYVNDGGKKKVLFTERDSPWCSRENVISKKAVKGTTNVHE